MFNFRRGRVRELAVALRQLECFVLFEELGLEELVHADHLFLHGDSDRGDYSTDVVEVLAIVLYVFHRVRVL
jgi:hypothetical protein